MTAVSVRIGNYFRGYNLSDLFSLEVRENEIRLNECKTVGVT
jgi:hypothetical protein